MVQADLALRGLEGFLDTPTDSGHFHQVRKKQRCGPARHQRMRAERPDQMWALDFQVDVTVDGRQVRFLNIIDEYTREALATRAARSFTADATISVLE